MIKALFLWNRDRDMGYVYETVSVYTEGGEVPGGQGPRDKHVAGIVQVGDGVFTLPMVSAPGPDRGPENAFHILKD